MSSARPASAMAVPHNRHQHCAQAWCLVLLCCGAHVLAFVLPCPRVLLIGAVRRQRGGREPYLFLLETRRRAWRWPRRALRAVRHALPDVRHRTITSTYTLARRSLVDPRNNWTRSPPHVVSCCMLCGPQCDPPPCE